MRIANGLVGLLMLGASGAALADEPLRLDAAQLDAVSAGAYSTFATGFTFPGFGQGNLISFGQLSQTATFSQSTITPTSANLNAGAQAAAAMQVQSVGAGATGAGGGGGVFTSVFLF
jgi:hypothetical protein